MQNLILLFVRHGGLLLFILLEGVCMYLVVQYNQKQNSIYFSSTSVLSGVVYNQYDDLMQYWNLADVADSLANENAKLYAQLDDAKFSRSIWRDTLRDDTLEQQYIFQSATIINNSINKYHNHITIDRGKNHGIRPSMGVLDANGIIGIVKSTSSNYSLVMSILHNQTRLSASVRSSNYFGSLSWKGEDPKHVDLNDVPKHAILETGDTIQTSSYSSIFPEGIMIGTIDSFWIEPGSNFYSIDVKLSNDLSNVRYVYVVENIMKGEQLELEEEVENE